MSLGVYLTRGGEELFWANITHNLGQMAAEADIYNALWRPHRLKKEYNIPAGNHDDEYSFENNTTTYAKDIIDIVEKGLFDMKSRPEHYEKFNSSNGWGLYKHFIPWIEKYLEALKTYPDAIISVSR